jgi:hypothetical protein
LVEQHGQLIVCTTPPTAKCAPASMRSFAGMRSASPANWPDNMANRALDSARFPFNVLLQDVDRRIRTGRPLVWPACRGARLTARLDNDNHFH